MRLKLTFFLIVFSLLFLNGLSKREETNSNRFKKWLNEVSPIITDSEYDVFKRLKAPLEKEKFIEEFWKRRDPTPETVENEFREEYQKRLAYVNEHFTCILPGYLTDRGKVYLLLGKPHLIFSYPMGLTENSPFRHLKIPPSVPVEIWQYRYISDYGVGVNFLFVSKNNNCNYTIINSVGELDALLGTFNQQTLRDRGEDWDFKDEFASYYDVRNVVLYGFSHRKKIFKNYEELGGKDFYLFDFNLINDSGKNVLYVFVKKNLKKNFSDYFLEIEDVKGEIVDGFNLKLINDRAFFPLFLKDGIYLLRIYCVSGNKIFRFSKRIEFKNIKSIGKILFLKNASKKRWSPFSIPQDNVFLTPLFSILNDNEGITLYIQVKNGLLNPEYEIYDLRKKLLFSFSDKGNNTLLKKGKFYNSYLAQLDINGMKKGFYKVVVKFRSGEKVFSSSSILFLK